MTFQPENDSFEMKLYVDLLYSSVINTKAMIFPHYISDNSKIFSKPQTLSEIQWESRTFITAKMRCDHWMKY